MTKHSPLLRSALALCVTLCAAGAACAMDNTDVLKMVDASISEETIIVAVRTADPADFDTSTEALIELKQRAVSEAIIQAMIVRKQESLRGDDSSGGRARVSFNEVSDDAVLPPEIDPMPGRDYFVRYSFKFEKGERLTTNYWRGEHVAINSRVNLVGIRGENITLRLLDSGRTLVIKNVPKFSGRSVDQVARELLSDTPTEIEKYGDDMARHIKTGTLRLGMTKTQVLLTRGYPPAHETSSLENDLWKYWSSRFIVQSLAFENDVLVEGRGIH